MSFLLEHLQDLDPNQAGELLSSLGVRWSEFPLVSHARPGKSLEMMDVDPCVLQMGSKDPGARLFAGGETSSFSTGVSQSTLIVDGDLVVDGVFRNSGLTLVKGNLLARGIISEHTYLVVLGDVQASGFVGIAESYGTYVVGRATLGAAALVDNHHLGVCGALDCTTMVHDEVHGIESVHALFSEWGLPREAYADGIDIQAFCSVLSELPLPEHASLSGAGGGFRLQGAQESTSEGLEELDVWLKEFPGNQREMLAAIQGDWLRRLAGEDQAQVGRLIRKAIKSPKLVSKRDALLQEIEQQSRHE